MRYRTLGETGIQVSAYCLGAMMLGEWGNKDHDDGVRIVHAALDGGINFVDTADVYSHGESEEIVGKALKGRRDDVVLATKVNFEMGPGKNNSGNSRRWIRYEVEQSLRRLGTDWIDLYQIHRPDPRTDIEETLSVLTDLIREGKVRAIGCSTFPAEMIVESHWAAERRGFERFRCEQPPYSLFARGIEAAVLPVCERYGMGVIAWSPLAGGWLTGKYRHGAEIDMTSGRASSDPAAFRPGPSRQSAQAGPGRPSRGGRHRHRDVSQAPGTCLRCVAPGRDGSHHRAKDHGPAAGPDRGLRDRLGRRHARPPGRDRAARDQRQSRRRRLAEPITCAGLAAPPAFGRARRRLRSSPSAVRSLRDPKRRSRRDPLSSSTPPVTSVTHARRSFKRRSTPPCNVTADIAHEPQAPWSCTSTTPVS